uniref:Uncharacterized protein n=1 Tax=Cacopsylla melanoneura TaxID=428564 RepID=A0A8D8L9D2_9HEMI
MFYIDTWFIYSNLKSIRVHKNNNERGMKKGSVKVVQRFLREIPGITDPFENCLDICTGDLKTEEKLRLKVFVKRHLCYFKRLDKKCIPNMYCVFCHIPYSAIKRHGSAAPHQVKKVTEG